MAIREKLVTCLMHESLPEVRKKIGDAVAEVARQYTDNGMLASALFKTGWIDI
mgnify:CR=1 FL=1